MIEDNPEQRMVPEIARNFIIKVFRKKKQSQENLDEFSKEQRLIPKNST